MPLTTRTVTIKYIDKAVPAGSPVPALYHFVCRKWPSGASVGPEQTFLTKPTVVSFDLGKGNYFVMGGQRDATGREIGTQTQSKTFRVK